MLETNNTVHSFLENLLVGMEMDSFFFVPSYFELYFSMNRSSTDELPAYIMLIFGGLVKKKRGRVVLKILV